MNGCAGILNSMGASFFCFVSLYAPQKLIGLIFFDESCVVIALG
jgi:hypothetical protein